MKSQLAAEKLFKVWQGIYSNRRPDLRIRLCGLDLRTGDHIAVCLSTAAYAYGFDTEEVSDLHVLSPVLHQLRSTKGLVIHRRDGVPLVSVAGRQATPPNWTAVDVARGLRRPRALATLDAALRSGTCDHRELASTADQQKGRRGIAHVRELIPLASGKADSPMESEARLVMHDAELPEPVLQHEIIDLDGRTWTVDFAWLDPKVAVEYDGYEFHSNKADFRRDRLKRAALEELDWRIISIVDDDVRRRPRQMVRRIATQLHR